MVELRWMYRTTFVLMAITTDASATMSFTGNPLASFPNAV
jgi:hypothetical protein